MTQNEMDRELDQIKQMIIILARRKYICKSELRKIHSGCRANAFSLADIESIMYSIIDDSVIYIDDTVVSDSFHSCVVIQEELKRAGYANLFQLLSVEEDSTLLEITEAYNRTKIVDIDPDFYDQIGLLLGTNDFLDMYRCLCLAQDVMYEFSLRKQFGLLSISEDERIQMINNLVVSCDVTPSTATYFIDNCMMENGIVVSEKKELSVIESQDEELDEFLIPRSGKIESESNKMGRRYSKM